MTCSAEYPNARSCCVPSMNACRGNGDVDANSRICFCIAAAASAEPNRVVNAALDDCSSVLYDTPNSTVDLIRFFNPMPAKIAAPAAATFAKNRPNDAVPFDCAPSKEPVSWESIAFEKPWPEGITET